MRTPVRVLALTAASAALLAASACGGSSDDKSDAKSSTSASASSSPSGSPSGSPSESASALPTYSDSTAKGDRPGLAKLSAALVKGSASSGQGYTQPQADCVAKILRGSKVSNVALNAIVKLDPSFKASAADNTALQGVAQQLSACSSAK